MGSCLRVLSVFFLWVFLFSSCGNQNSDPNPDPIDVPPPPAQLSFNKTSGGDVEIVVPPAFFGEDGNVVEPSHLLGQIDVFKNNVISVTVEPEAAFDSERNAVLLRIAAIVGDRVSILVRPEGRPVLNFSIEVADTLIADSGESVDCTTTTNAGQQLVCVLCKTVHSCVPALDFDRCLMVLPADVDLDNDFGLPEGSTPVQGIIDGVEDGLYSAEPKALSTCLDGIGNLTCELVATGYSAESGDNTSGFENFIPDDCSSVFK